MLKQASRWLQGLRKTFWTFEKKKYTQHKYSGWGKTQGTPLDGLRVSVGCCSLCRREGAKQTTTHSINLNDGVSVKKCRGEKTPTSAAGTAALGGPVLPPPFPVSILGCVLRLNYRVLCIVVLLFTVIAHHLKAHSYTRIRHRRRSVQWVYV